MTLSLRLAATVSLLLTMLAVTAVDGQMFTDEQAVVHIDYLSDRGIKHLLRWREHFLSLFASVDQTLTDAEVLLDNDFSADVRPNITAKAADVLSSLESELSIAEAKVDNLNLTASGDGLEGFFASPDSIVNVNGDYDDEDGTYTVPRHGLYQITVRSKPVWGPYSISIMRNGNETLGSFTHTNGWDLRTRITLMWLNPGDQIFTTGSDPAYFGVVLLRVQHLMPDFLN